ncbi:hypothetical protein [Chamaesiphon polymorphus]|uniref:Uncharacterized protein n=1 Tax=Chamaesiphon polymorphus CCALA 037 TaxID=2107692 RepID=A0A2T1FDF6_9CYAN|nr:hypothetical protein [Chamaesiphon polymorphus]PSB42968.1 hypothetical protein C7B77_26420 [Chamaesiphon polymorphus CCALA 037]
MNTRSEAVQYLQEHGYEAFERDWAMGKTIGIPTGKKRYTKIGDGFLEGWDGIMWVYPIEEGWAVDDGWTDDDIDHKKFSSLNEAVLAAREIAAAINRGEWHRTKMSPSKSSRKLSRSS